MNVNTFMEWFMVALIGVQVLAVIWMVLDLSGALGKLADLWEWIVDNLPSWYAKLRRAINRKERKRYLMNKRVKAQLDEGVKRMRQIEKEGRKELLAKQVRNMEDLEEFDRKMKRIESTAYVTGAGPVAKAQDRIIEDWLNEITAKDRKTQRKLASSALRAAEIQRDLDDIRQQMEKARPKKQGWLAESAQSSYAVHYSGWPCTWGGNSVLATGHPKQVTCPNCARRLRAISRY